MQFPPSAGMRYSPRREMAERMSFLLAEKCMDAVCRLALRERRRLARRVRAAVAGDGGRATIRGLLTTGPLPVPLPRCSALSSRAWKVCLVFLASLRAPEKRHGSLLPGPKPAEGTQAVYCRCIVPPHRRRQATRQRPVALPGSPIGRLVLVVCSSRHRGTRGSRTHASCSLARCRRFRRPYDLRPAGSYK